MYKFNTPRPFLLAPRVSILCNCDAFVSNFKAAEFQFFRVQWVRGVQVHPSRGAHDSSTFFFVFRQSFIFRHPRRLGAFYDVYTKPLSSAVWICTCITLFTIGFILYFLVKFKSGGNEDTSLSLVMLSVIGAVCQQGIHIKKKSIVVRTVMLVTLFFTLTLYQYYNANVVSTLLHDPPKNIRTLKDLLKSPLKVGVEDVLYNKDYFKGLMMESQGKQRHSIMRRRVWACRNPFVIYFDHELFSKSDEEYRSYFGKVVLKKNKIMNICEKMHDRFQPVYRPIMIINHEPQGRIYHMAFWASAQGPVDSRGPRLSQGPLNSRSDPDEPDRYPVLDSDPAPVVDANSYHFRFPTRSPFKEVPNLILLSIHVPLSILISYSQTDYDLDSNFSPTVDYDHSPVLHFEPPVSVLGLRSVCNFDSNLNEAGANSSIEIKFMLQQLGIVLLSMSKRILKN
ncbi:hypothetical protein EVAR_82942_1 [Eumeta japonica]|uniref:Ionotropic glutamate receptor C-terminal domain-containing protein n=1 Tax=Eumeta variegata TaxID=151549 RepID=A0A4C1X2A2_EUMVA|nr:hypothetical protein EVAR_82942_1 [Eumeta japonica]